MVKKLMNIQHDQKHLYKIQLYITFKISETKIEPIYFVDEKNKFAQKTFTVNENKPIGILLMLTTKCKKNSLVYYYQ